MIEVFKTNVADKHQAKMLVASIQETFADHKANFDLDDCDKILRVQCTNGDLCPSTIIHLLARLGFYAEVLPDNEPVFPEYLNV
jgi:hypothetical protein